MADFDPAGAARWLAEAVETGNPLGPLPDDLAPRDLAQAEEVAAATLEALEITPCGLRVLRRAGAPALSGPMIEGRLLPAGAEVAVAALRHPVISAAVIGVLAEPLDPEATAPPILARLHPALDVSATRFTAAPEDAVALTADLARLGLVVAGKGRALPPGPCRVGLAAKGTRAKPMEVDLAALLAGAAAEARRWGGLPAGALLVVAGLTPPVAAAGHLRASLGPVGAVEARFG